MNPWLEFLRQIFGMAPGQNIFDPRMGDHLGPNLGTMPVQPPVHPGPVIGTQPINPGPGRRQPIGDGPVTGLPVQPRPFPAIGTMPAPPRREMSRGGEIPIGLMPVTPGMGRGRKMGQPFQNDGQMPGQRTGQLRDAQNMGMNKKMASTPTKR